jgi:hypothetical protein
MKLEYEKIQVKLELEKIHKCVREKKRKGFVFSILQFGFMNVKCSFEKE